MPSKWTFTIKPIRQLLDRYVGNGKGWIDPFAGIYSPAEFTNDLNPEMPTKYHLEAKDFIEILDKNYIGGLYDPPYSLRQIMECYRGFGLTVDKKYATTKFYTDVKTMMANKIRINGHAICFGWNSIGFGKKRGFRLIEVLLVCHGRLHNDTIVTVEKKVNRQIELSL